MSASIQPIVVEQARAGGSFGVIVLAERSPVPRGMRGLAPLAADGHAERTEELAHTLRHVLQTPAARGSGGLAPLAVADTGRGAQGSVILRNLGGLMASVDSRGLAQVEHTKGVRKVIAIPQMLPLVMPLRYRLAAPADLRPGPTLALRRMGIPALWDAGLRGHGMKIAHFDTGISADHPAFDALRTEGRLHYAAFDRSGRQLRRPKPRDQELASLTYHGTHTAGTLVGGEVDGTAIGIAPEASLISVQIFPRPRPRSREEHGELVVQALDWILGEQPDVVNLSFGETGYNDTFLGVIQDMVVEQHIPVVAAIGNGGPGTSCSPGNYGQVISVGAVDTSGRIGRFSGNSGPSRRIRPDLSAPGVDIVSAGKGDDMAVSDGTSMAAPHIAGLLALARQKNRGLKPAGLKRLLKETAAVPRGWDPALGGAGVVDGRRLLARL